MTISANASTVDDMATLLAKCRTKAADDLRNQQHRPETHVMKWRETKEALDDEELELTKLNKNYQENLNGVADVYEACLNCHRGHLRL